MPSFYRTQTLKIESQPMLSNFDMSKAEHIATIDLCYNYGQWTLHFSYRYETHTTTTGKEVIGVDIGEIHPIPRKLAQNVEIERNLQTETTPATAVSNITATV